MAPHKKPKPPGLAAVVAALPPVGEIHGEFRPSPGNCAEFTDAHGQHWRRRGRALDRRRALRLVRDPEVVVMTGFDLYRLDAAERAALWAEAGPVLDGHGDVSYRAHEFTSESGLTLLYLERHC